MRPFGSLLDFDSALKAVLADTSTLDETEFVEIGLLLGRVLAEDIQATMSIPPFDRAAMDGFAVMAEDTFGASRRQPKQLTIVGKLYAGQFPEINIDSGQAIQIATGAPVPKGADAVVMVEETETKGDSVCLYKSAFPGLNIGREGEDIRIGETILKRLEVFNPGKIGVLASQGLSGANVIRKPRVAILPTGEEVASTGTTLQPGQIFDINTHTLASVVEQSGGIPVRQAIALDQPNELQLSLEKALGNDMVVISGGSSVGERDLMFTILEKMGQVKFHGIQIKPGKPTMFAIVDNKPVFGMPGYPTSCLINAYILLQPAVRKLAGLPSARPNIVKAELTHNISGSVGRRQFLPVTIKDGFTTPLFKESGAITATSHADGYLDIPQNVDILYKGSVINVHLFRD
jgi:molybdenum cofactor synthesis domain-containing protein